MEDKKQTHFGDKVIPVEEKRRLAYFEPVYVGLGVHGERLAEIRLYQRAK